VFLILWFGAWLDFFFFFGKLIINALIRGVFKDFISNGFPSLKDMCVNKPLEDRSR
jgi:hypothetical protein